MGIDVSKLSALIESINNIDTVIAREEGVTSEEDIVGRVYEYFLGEFAATEGKGGGEFYTPKCVVNLIAEMIEPYQGKISSLPSSATPSSPNSCPMNSASLMLKSKSPR